MLQEAFGRKNTIERFRTLDREEIINRHRKYTLTDQNAVYFRTALDSFRQEGFFPVLLGRIRQVELDDEVRARLQGAEGLISAAITRRLMPNPLDGKTAAERVNQEIEEIVMIQSILLGALEIEHRIPSDSPDRNASGYTPLSQVYRGFIQAMSKILHAELPYVVRKGDCLSLEHGTVYLESQGLRIHIGPLSDRIGLHTAYIGPCKSFGHIHSSRLTERPNWEYHFVLPGQKGSHVVGDSRCDMDFANGDIIGVPVDTPHGGYNHDAVPLELHFCAGGDIPWDYPPKDLSQYDVSQSTHIKDLGKVNGVSLKPALEGLGHGIHTIIDPRKLGGAYGIEFRAVVAAGQGVEWESTGELIQVWSGDGMIEVVGTAMKALIGPGDKCALLPGVRYRIVSSGPGITTLNFAMIDL